MADNAHTPERAVKTVQDSRTEQVHILFPKALNNQGRLYGGELLGWLDEVAGLVSMRHCGMSTVTACVDHLDFKSGAGLGDVVYINGYLTYVGNTSMEVRIDSYVEDMKSGRRHMINSAYFVMVAVDENGHPAQVPMLAVSTVSEQAEWEAGKRRQDLRKKRSREGF